MITEAAWILLVVLAVLALWGWWFATELRNALTDDGP